MIRAFHILCLTAAVAFAQESASNPAPSPTPAAGETTDVSARSKVLELAGAFSNDSYKIRDGFWSGELEPGRPKFLEVNLFAGNEYWFSGAMLPPAQKIAISVFDGKGRPVDFQVYEDGTMAAAGFAPEVSGRYFVKFTLLEGDKSQFCLIYSYK